MGKTEIEALLSHLAVKGKVSAVTQRQALNAIIFLYDKALDLPVKEITDPVVKAKNRRRPPVVVTQKEARRVFDRIRGFHLLMAR